MRLFKHIIFLLCLTLHIPLFCDEFGDNKVKNLLLIDESIGQVLHILENFTGKSILYDQAIANVKITLQIKHQTSKYDAIRAIENVLSLNGIAIIDHGDGFLHAVSARSAATHAPEWIDGSSLPMATSDKFYTKLFTLKNIKASELSKTIQTILSPGVSSIIPFENTNCMMITDHLANLQRIELLINNIDKQRRSDIESKIFRIKHANASNISSIVKKLISKISIGENSYGKKDENLPTLNQKIIPGSQQNTVQEALRDSSDFKFSRNVSIEHDEHSNSIIVCGTTEDIKHVENIVNGLDVLLDQVRIEVVIAQVTLMKNQTSGLESLGISYNAILDSNGGSTYSSNNRTSFHGVGAKNTKIESAIDLSGTFNKFSLAYVFNKAKSCDNITILSAPTIVTTHNREASIKVGESRPVITANFTDLQNQNSMKNSVNYKDIGIELTVTPLIGINGIIQLKIDQLIQKINGEIRVDGNSQPIISKRQAVSFVSVQDGNVVVLAGLQEKELTDTKGKLWLLGYLPIVGDLLFSPTTKSEQTNELIIFIRPSIIKNPSDENEYAKQLTSESIFNEEIESYVSSGKFLKENNDLDYESKADQKKETIKSRRLNNLRSKIR